MSSRKDDIIEVEVARQPVGRSNGGQSADRRKVDELLLGGDHLIALVIILAVIEQNSGSDGDLRTMSKFLGGGHRQARTPQQGRMISLVGFASQ